MKIKPDQNQGGYGYRWSEPSVQDGERFIAIAITATDHTVLGEIYVTIPPKGPWRMDVHHARKKATLLQAMELLQRIPTVEQIVATLDQDPEFRRWLANRKFNTEQVTWDPVPMPTRRPHVVIHQMAYEGTTPESV